MIAPQLNVKFHDNTISGTWNFNKQEMTLVRAPGERFYDQSSTMTTTN